MSRDDYISKLFIKNQDKLEQAPSPDLWSRLEAELDAVPEGTTPEVGPPTAGRVRRLWLPYAVAASVLLLLAVGGYYRSWMYQSPSGMLDDEPIALATEPEYVLTESEPYLATPEEAMEPTTVQIIEEQEAAEVEKQEQRIVEAVKVQLEKAPSPKVADVAEAIDIKDVEVADEVDDQPVEWVEPNPIALANMLGPEEALGGGRSTTNTPQQPDYYQNNRLLEESELSYNYNRNIVPQLSNQDISTEQVDRVIEQAEAYENSDPSRVQQKTRKEVTTSYTKRSRGGIVAQADKGAGIESPMAKAHPRLYPFGFLIGKWEDDKELEGKSYEVWRLRNRTTLQGKGYKLSSDGTQVFEETFKIVFKNGQVFLQLSFEEGQRPTEYLLTSFTQERFVFEQRQYARQPNRIVLQQNGLDGYSFTMTNTNNNVFLSADQQRYLENRNRVSNVRSTRTLRAAQ